jgi:transcriptional regulator with XRE-family HTH domain
MASRYESLDQFVRRVLKEKGLSPTLVEQRSNGRISDSYIYSIVSGSTGSLTISKLRALATGLGVPEDDVFAAARGVAQEDDLEFRGSDFANLFSKYKELPPDDKRDIHVLLDTLAFEIERRQLRMNSRLDFVAKSLVA